MGSQPSPGRPRQQAFGPFVFDVQSGELWKHGVPVRLRGQPLQLLASLLRQPGQVVTRDEFQQQLWKGSTFGDFDHGLNAAMNRLRQALGDSADQPRYVETLPGRGYRFIAPVSEKDPHPSLATGDVSAAGISQTGSPRPEVFGPRLHSLPSLRIWVIVAILGAAVASTAYFVSRSSPARPANRIDSVLVLPFLSLTSRPEDEQFADGLTEELTNVAAHLEGLRVVARTTAFQFKGKATDIRSLGRQLRVGAVLEGSVRRQDGKLRVTVQLNDAETGYHIWSETFDRDAGDIFSVQDDLASRVAHILRPNSPPARSLRGRNREAYNLYLLGRFHIRKPDRVSVRKAIGYFEEAIRKDKGYAAAYAGLAECYTKLAQTNFEAPVDAWVEARKAADQALALDDNLSEAHTARAIVDLHMNWDWEAAGREFRRALALNPNDAGAHHWFSHYFFTLGRMSESLTESQAALDLDPLDVQISAHLILHYVNARDWESAIKAGLQTLELDPQSQLAHIFLTLAYEGAGQWEKAIDAEQRSSKPHPLASVVLAAFRSEGPRGYWRVKQEFLARQENQDNYRLAIAHARLGDATNALARLRQALQNREPNSICFRNEPAFDSLKEDRRLKELAKTLKFP